MVSENGGHDDASFSGRTRRRTTSRGVHLANRAAGIIITLGGSATILAVSLVCVFLVWVVIPLFLPASVEDAGSFEAPAESYSDAVPYVEVDEYGSMAWFLDESGAVHLRDLHSGEALADLDFLGGRTPTAISSVLDNGNVALGFADGTVQLARISFSTQFLGPDDLPEDTGDLAESGRVAVEGGIIERTPEGQYRRQTISATLQDPIEIEPGSAIRLIDLTQKSQGPMLAALTASNTLHFSEVTTKRNLLTNKTTTNVVDGKLPLEFPAGEPAPEWLKLSGQGDTAYLCWVDGRLVRYDTSNVRQPEYADTVLIAPETDAEVTALEFLIGKTSLVSGDNRGRIRVWFLTRSLDAKAPDGRVLSMAHEFPSEAGAVTAISASERSRMIAAGYAGGSVHIHHITSERHVAGVPVASSGGAPVRAVALAPKDDGLLALVADRAIVWRVDAPHPEITVNAIMTPVWYEGFEAPAQVWQSSSGTDDFEPKYGLYPLIFGTLKATVYSMLFGVPAALLAAVYTSEMMGRRARMRVKPVIEMMASLPSVVLGFLAALVVAPWIEHVVPASLLIFATIPFTILLGAHLWQLLPRRFATRHDRWRIVFVVFAIALGAWLSIALGPTLERTLFAGDMRAWLDGQVGTGTGGWMLLLFPLTCLVCALSAGRFINPWFLSVSSGWSDMKIALTRLWLFLGLSFGAAAAALLVSYLLANGPFGLWSLDPRGGFVDTYVQRNAFVVGFIMGFAIIPIIYTISEDALSAVPDHLRTASLGSGATPWQTAVRIIIPTAASGLFSAVMIGFGRAVGETMIVLMAAGNTPVMDWNIFNGFRTLSANIAVELPEAVRDSTHYRMLFLAALSLFVITFVLNTAAETVRQRFRKRAFQI